MVERSVGGPHRGVGLRGPRHRRRPCDAGAVARRIGGLAGVGTAAGKLVQRPARGDPVPKGRVTDAWPDTIEWESRMISRLVGIAIWDQDSQDGPGSGSRGSGIR